MNCELHIEYVSKSFDSNCNVAYTGLLYDSRNKTPITLRTNFDTQNTTITFNFLNEI